VLDECVLQLEIYVFDDKDQHARRSELCWSMLSTCGCRGIGAPKISLVNEVQCGTGTEWRDLIGQHCGLALEMEVPCLSRANGC